jgi:hypothetical protein
MSSSIWQRRRFIIYAVLICIPVAWHLYVRVATYNMRISIAKMLDVPLDWVRPALPPVILQTPYGISVKRPAGQELARLAFHGTNLFAVSIPSDSPLQAYRTISPLDRKAAVTVAKQMVSDILGVPSSELKSLGIEPSSTEDAARDSWCVTLGKLAESAFNYKVCMLGDGTLMHIVLLRQ